MEEFKGTSGPWEAVADSINSVAIQTEEDGSDVALITADNEKDLLTELEWANARLIAAAPDLLAALQQLTFLHACEQEGIASGQPTAEQWYRAVEEANLAIQKALG